MHLPAAAVTVAAVLQLQMSDARAIAIDEKTRVATKDKWKDERGSHDSHGQHSSVYKHISFPK